MADYVHFVHSGSRISPIRQTAVGRPDRHLLRQCPHQSVNGTLKVEPVHPTVYPTRQKARKTLPAGSSSLQSDPSSLSARLPDSTRNPQRAPERQESREITVNSLSGKQGQLTRCRPTYCIAFVMVCSIRLKRGVAQLGQRAARVASRPLVQIQPPRQLSSLVW